MSKENNNGEKSFYNKMLIDKVTDYFRFLENIQSNGIVYNDGQENYFHFLCHLNVWKNQLV